VSKMHTWLDGIGLAQYANAFETNDIVARSVRFH
jgi:SAM domain (Sterile alpha motif)